MISESSQTGLRSQVVKAQRQAMINIRYKNMVFENE